MIRNVVVPSKDKAPSAICISQNTIKSVRDKSVVRTREEIQLELENARQEQQDSMDAAALRKKKFQEADLEKQVSFNSHAVSYWFCATNRINPKMVI